MEINEDLTKYIDDVHMPVTHLISIQTYNSIPTSDDLYILDSGTSHTILKRREYFQHITPSNRQVTMITSTNQLEQGHGPARVILPNQTVIHIADAIFAP